MESPAAYGCAVIVSTAGQCQNDGCSMWGISHGPKSGAATHVFDARKYSNLLHQWGLPRPTNAE